MRHHSCAHTAGGGAEGGGDLWIFQSAQLYELLFEKCCQVVPSRLCLPAVCQILLLLSLCSVCRSVNPTAHSHPNPSMHPSARKPAWGTSFLTHNDLSIWGEVIHLAHARGLHFNAFISTPPYPPACPCCSVSWFCRRGFRRRWGWTDQHTAGLVFSVRLVKKPGQFLLHAPTSAGWDCYSWNVHNLLQIWGCYGMITVQICFLLYMLLLWHICTYHLKSISQLFLPLYEAKTGRAGVSGIPWFYGNEKEGCWVCQSVYKEL